MPAHKFTVTLEHDEYSEEKFELFRDYQIHVHGDPADEVSKGGFKRFLCHSPLQRHNPDQGKKIGSWHQCYRIDGRLIAMAVLDLLPAAVSAVYFIYHQDFEQWSFGKLSAMRETALALEHDYQYYYMGYYIAGCQKMRYKADYKPQYLLDPIKHTWELLEGPVKAFVDTGGYSVKDCADVGQPGRRRQDHPRDSDDPTSSDSACESDLQGSFTGQDGHTWYFKDPIRVQDSARAAYTCGMLGVLTLADLMRMLPTGMCIDDADRVELPLAWVPIRISRTCTVAAEVIIIIRSTAHSELTCDSVYRYGKIPLDLSIWSSYMPESPSWGQSLTWRHAVVRR